MLVEHPEEGEDEGEAVVVLTVIARLAPVQPKSLLQAEVPVLPPVGITHHVRHGGVSLGQVNHEALLPVLAPVPSQAGLVELHHLALAVRHGDMEVALVVVILEKTACNTTQPVTPYLSIPFSTYDFSQYYTQSSFTELHTSGEIIHIK